jgi:hypothetical protein
MSNIIEFIPRKKSETGEIKGAFLTVFFEKKDGKFMSDAEFQDVANEFEEAVGLITSQTQYFAHSVKAGMIIPKKDAKK